MTEKSSKKPLVIVVAGALVDADGRVLITRRPNGKEMAGLWEFPGGKIEKGETPEQALIRELKEELNIETKGTCLAPSALPATSMRISISSCHYSFADAGGAIFWL